MLRPRSLLAILAVLALTLVLLPHPSNPEASILTHTTGIELSGIIPSTPKFRWSDWVGQDGPSFEDNLTSEDDGSSARRGSAAIEDGERLSAENGNKGEALPTTSPQGLTYHPNGYLLVQDPGTAPAPLSPHPILTLIERAEAAWQQRLDRNSKSLDACVAEYRRRYGRPPPYGFEKWWQYAVEHKVILKDEYDQINRDLTPFLALEPKDLMHRLWVMANERPESFTLSIEKGQVGISGSEGHLERASDLANIIKRFSASLGDGPVINLTFTKHDQPTVQMSWGRKQKMWDMAAMGEYFSPSEYVQPPVAGLSNWANACPPNSALYLNETARPSPLHALSTSAPRSFIYDHPSAMDPCLHPEAKHLHGFTSAAGTDNSELVPMFTFAKTTTQSDILVTPLEQFSDTYIGDDPVWETKKFNKLLWRGSTTGAEFRSDVQWWDSQRARLHFMTHAKGGETAVLAAKDRHGKEVRVEKKAIAELNERFMATSLSGGPVQCDPTTCKKMVEIIDFAPTMGLDDSYQYKYLIDVDGNGWSGRFHRLMSTKSIVFKSTIFPEWYMDRVMPWVHYVPVKVDYSDLYDIMQFFVGTSAEDSHDSLAAKIAAAGKSWAAEHWRREDMASYMFRLILEWRRILYRGTGEPLDYIDA